MSDEEPLGIKMLTIGDSGVGKSWLLLRWASEPGKFEKLIKSGQSMMTIGIDFKMKNVEIDGRRVKLQIWDTAGQERFRTITTSYYRNSQGILLVYDITNRSSFTNIRTWIQQIQQHADTNVDKILIGNKCDLGSGTQRVVSYDEGEALAREYKMDFLETSAMTDVNVEDAFMTIACNVKTRLEAAKPASSDEDSGGGVTLSNGSSGGKKKSGFWCSIL